jgi:hypothetical protein
MKRSAHQKWEYLTITSDEHLDLNRLGAEGWEVVTSTDVQDSSMILKRPALTFQEEVTIDQRKRYFGTWGVDIDEIDRESIG